MFVYVSQSGNDNGIGSINDPYKTIQKGINDANEGDTVLVKGGTYAGQGNTDINIQKKNLLVRSFNGPRRCIIDCQGANTGFDLEYPITSNAVIHGFTIMNASTAGIAFHTDGYVAVNNYITRNGLGIDCCLSSSPVIRRNIIYNNNGNGISISDSTHPEIHNNRIQANSGNGIEFSDLGLTLRNNIITFNAKDGIRAGAATLTVINNTIAANGRYGIFYGAYLPIPNLIIRRSIILQNKSQQVITQSGGQPHQVKVRYSDIEGGQQGLTIGSGGSLQWGPGNL